MANTHSVPHDTHGKWSLDRGSNAILTLVGVDRSLIKLLGYEYREDALVGGGSREWQTHTHTQCPSLYTGWMEPRA